MFWKSKKSEFLTREEAEKRHPHTYKCKSCEVTWVEKGLEPVPCFICDKDVVPRCDHWS